MKKISVILFMAALGVISSCAPRSQSSQQSGISSNPIASSSVVSSSVSSSVVVEEKKFNLTELKDFVREEYYNDNSLWYYNQSDMRIADKTLPEFLMSVDKFVFIPPVPEKGFNIPYVIRFPSGNYKNENIGLKKHLLLANYGSPANPDYGFALLKYINQHVYDSKPFVDNENIPIMTSEVLDIPIITPIVTWTRASAFKDYDQVLNINLDRESVIADEDNINEYFKVEYDINNRKIYNIAFEKYEYYGLINLEKQFYSIINHSIDLLNNFNYNVENKIFMRGFSSTGDFTQRFSTIYPEIIKAYFAGGTVVPILPGKKFNNTNLSYPLGVYEHKELFDREFNIENYNNVAKINIVGKYENSFSAIDRYIGDNVTDLIFKERIEFDNNPREDKMETYWNNNIDIFYSLGGKGMFIFNTETAHYLNQNDFNFSIEFFRMNTNSDIPVYPNSSPYPEHIIRLS
jgi:hypothetical protein